MKIKLHFFLLLFCNFLSFGHNYPLSSEAKISVLTCGSGEELHSIFGHTAIRILDQKQGIDIVYNYGMFDFNTPNFYLKFVKGDLYYHVSKGSFEHFMYSYRMENRSVYEQELNFSSVQKQQLFDELEKSLYSEERFYIYKFIDKNCTTMVVDKINNQLEQPSIVKIGNTTESYRHVLNPFMDNLFYQKLGINIMFGYRTDQPAEQLFLPIELLKSLEVTKINQLPIAQKTKVLFEKDNTILSKSWWNSIYTFILFLVLILISNKNKIYLTFLILLGFLGIFLSTVGFYSLHREVSQNYNVLLFNPFLIGFVITFIKKNAVWFNRLFYFILFCFSVYLLFILNKAHLFLMLPILILETLILLKLKARLKQS
jgi:hypothetical protein